jgi:hypothetical protein
MFLAVFPLLSKEAQMPGLLGWFHLVPWLRPHALRMASCYISDQGAVNRVVSCMGARVMIPCTGPDRPVHRL